MHLEMGPSFQLQINFWNEWTDSLRLQLPFMNAWLKGRCCDIISESFAIKKFANHFALVPATNKIHVIGSQAHVDN